MSCAWCQGRAAVLCDQAEVQNGVLCMQLHERASGLGPLLVHLARLLHALYFIHAGLATACLAASGSARPR